MLSVGFAQKSPAPSPKDEVFPLRTVSHNAFQPGEKLTYVLHYGWLNAGEATLELKEGDREIEGRKVLHAVGKGQSTGAFKAFYKVDDRWTFSMKRAFSLRYLHVVLTKADTLSAKTTSTCSTAAR